MLELLAIVAIVGIILWTYRTTENKIEEDQARKEPQLDSLTISPAPVLTQQNPCGCGRSSTGFCVGLHGLSDEAWAVHADNPNAKKPRKPRAKKSAQ